MKSILNAIKQSLPGLVSAIKDIAIIPDPDFVPEEARYPFVGIKDGEIRTDGVLDPLTTYYVHLYCYVQILRPEASIVGEGWLGEQGLLDLVNQVVTALDSLGDLGISSIINWGKDPNEPASEMGWHGPLLGSSYTQRKRITYWYRKNQ